MANALLFSAITSGQQDAVASLLEQDDALVNAKNGSGQTPLHVRSDSHKHTAGRCNRGPRTLSIVAHTEFVLVASESAVQVATSLSALPLLQLLLAYGANVNALTDPRFGGLSPLHIAARYDALDAGRILLSSGANPNLASAGGCSTVLHECAKFGSLAFATWIASIPNIDLSAPDAAGFTPGYYARKAGNKAMLKLFPPASATKFDLWSQLEREPHYAQNKEAIKALMEKKAKIAEKKAEAAEKKKKKKPW